MALVKKNGIQLNKVAVDPFEEKLLIPTFFSVLFFRDLPVFVRSWNRYENLSDNLTTALPRHATPRGSTSASMYIV